LFFFSSFGGILLIVKTVECQFKKMEYFI